jgi:hypothetical protein
MPLEPTVYAIMVTGKDERRVAFARHIGIKNFDMQDYQHKKMIIVNHGNTKVLTRPRDDIFELMVTKGNMTLGDLRNIALELVPLNAIWYVHDDDDFRQTHYISHLLTTLLKSKSIAVFLKNRLEYNLANGFTFKSSFSYGNTHIMCIKLDRLKYMSKDTLEDTSLQKDIKSFKKKYIALDNDPKLYIRIIHQNNTSPFAHDSRKEVVNYAKESYYQEHDAAEDEKKYAQEIIQKYYTMFLYSK